MPYFIVKIVLSIIFILNIVVNSYTLNANNNSSESEALILDENDLENGLQHSQNLRLINDIKVTKTKILDFKNYETILNLDGKTLKERLNSDMYTFFQISSPFKIVSEQTTSKIVGGQYSNFEIWNEGIFSLIGNVNISGMSEVYNLFIVYEDSFINIFGSKGKNQNGITLNNTNDIPVSVIDLVNNCKGLIKGHVELFAKYIVLGLFSNSTMELIGDTEDDVGIVINGTESYGIFLEESHISFSKKITIEGYEEAIKFADTESSVLFKNKIIHFHSREFDSYFIFTDKEDFLSLGVEDEDSSLTKFRHSLYIYTTTGDKINININKDYLDTEKYDHYKFHESGCISDKNQSIIHRFYEKNVTKLYIVNYGTNISSPITKITTEDKDIKKLKKGFVMIKSIKPTKIYLNDNPKEIDMTIEYEEPPKDLEEIQIISTELLTIYETIPFKNITKVNPSKYKFTIPVKSYFAGSYDFKSVLADKEVVSYVEANCMLRIIPNINIESITLYNVEYNIQNIINSALIYNKNKVIPQIIIKYNNSILDRERFKITTNRKIDLEYSLNRNNKYQIVINTEILFQELKDNSINITIEDTLDKGNNTFNFSIKFLELISISSKNIYLEKNFSNIILTYNQKFNYFKGIDIIKKSNKKVVKSYPKNKVLYSNNLKTIAIKIDADDKIPKGVYLIRTKFDKKNLDFIQNDLEIVIETKLSHFGKTFAICLFCGFAAIVLIYLVISRCANRSSSNIIENVHKFSEKKELNSGLIANINK